jgi:hypothetical protein
MPFVPGLRDTIVQSLYDTEVIPAAGVTSLRFFTGPVGTQFQTAGIRAKVKADTNMTLSGQLPNPYTHRVYAVRWAFQWNVVRADAIIAVNNAAYIFEVGAKSFLEMPARSIPGGNNLYTMPFFRSDAAATDITVSANGWPSADNVFKLGRAPVLLSPTENFNVRFEWPAAQAVSVNCFITQYLDGVLRRGAQ